MAASVLAARQLWSTAPPEPRSREANWPSVLYSWWCTSFATAIILIRLNGRKVRSGQLFREDWIMIAALVPLWTRMILVHFVLIYGTNNIQTTGYNFTDVQLDHHAVGARLVLASRIIYAMFIWMSKWVVSEFLKRITISLWRRSYEVALQGIRIFLVVTFIAVVVATLTECQPFNHYWQVIPDPGAQCRQGFAQLLTMGIADMITDVFLIAFPIPIVLRSGQPWTRKLLLTGLFSSSIILIVITGLRMPEVIAAQGRQQYRTVWASSEILASTFVANFIIIGSFLRDKGTKKNKYRALSVSESLERTSTRRPTVVAINTNDSDEDLFRSLGCRVPDHLQDPDSPQRQALPAACMSSPYSGTTAAESEPLTSRREAIERGLGEISDDDSAHSPKQRNSPIPSPAISQVSKRQMSFFDVGGLLEHGTETRSQPSTAVASRDTAAFDFAPPSPTDTRRGSRAMLADLSAFLSSTGPEPRRGQTSAFTTLANRYRDPPSGVRGPLLSRQDTDLSLQDAGGLLGASRGHVGSLQDLGGLLDEDRHDVDANAIALQQRSQTRQAAVPSQSLPSSRATAVSRDYESLDLQDPGGLLR